MSEARSRSGMAGRRARCRLPGPETRDLRRIAAVATRLGPESSARCALLLMRGLIGRRQRWGSSAPGGGSGARRGQQPLLRGAARLRQTTASGMTCEGGDRSAAHGEGHHDYGPCAWPCRLSFPSGDGWNANDWDASLRVSPASSALQIFCAAKFWVSGFRSGFRSVAIRQHLPRAGASQ